MNVLSLFDGIASGLLSLNRAWIKVDKYYSSEIDKYAIAVAESNHRNVEQLGDVENWRHWPLDWASIDLLIAGSPCQGFSYAGEQLAFDDPRSKLFFVYVDILNHIKTVNPNVKFLLENVKMKAEFVNVISETLGVEPIAINSSLVSAQNRPRLYWFNWQFYKLTEKGIVLKDILQTNVNDKYYHSEKMMLGFAKRKAANVKRGAGFGHNIADVDAKTKTLLARYYKDGKECIVKDEKGHRKLTPVECERLQTVPDNYTACVSDTQRYKMLGNGWTINVIVHLLICLKRDLTPES